MTATSTTTPSGGSVHEGQGFHPPDDGDAPRGPLDEIKNGLKVWADVGLTLGKSVDDLGARFERTMNRLQKYTPKDYGIAQASPYPAAGVLCLNFGSPDQGDRWEVTGVIIGGADANVAAAGTAALYVGALAPTNNQPAPGGLTNAADLYPALPVARTYGTRQLVVNDQEYLFAVIFAGTAGQTYVGNISATVFNVAAAQGRDTTVL